jgi:hypothetical protein
MSAKPVIAEAPNAGGSGVKGSGDEAENFSPAPSAAGATWKLIGGHKVVTQFWAKPIPTARWDWSATEEDYDYGRPIGTGATEQEAIDDLLEQLESFV